jgi:hypothetical protein
VEKRWDDVRKFAIEALKISAANAEALNLKTEAENNLSPTLTVNAYVDGKKVNAVIRALKTEPDRSKHPWRLVKGKEYAFEVFYRDAQGRYSGEIPEFRCKQNGLHFKNVTLKKMFDGVVDCKGVKLEMQKINAGTFIMGSPEQELSRDNDEVPHKVTLTSNFWIGKYEVTQAQYAAVMNTNPSEFKGFNHPVEMVSYDDAKEFCKQFDEGMVWYLENCEMSVCDLYRSLWQMKNAGWFENANAFLIGRTRANNTIGDFTYEDVLHKVFDDMNVKVIYDVDFGHVQPQWAMVNGSYAKFEYKDGKGKMETYLK